tara:strand:- start:128 stop:745 length:618 start_codon:yes stop_codon:yes gene_type:complete
MNLKNRIRVALGLKADITLSVQEKLEDGTIIVSTSDMLEAGADVSILVEDGSTILLAPGEYTLEDGRGFIVVEDGVISEMVEEVEEEVVAEPENEEEVTEEVVEEDVVLDRQPKKVKSTKEYEFSQDELIKAISSAVNEVLSGYSKDINTLQSKVAKLSKAPASDEMVVNKFSSQNTIPTKLTKAQVNSMTARERIRYNLNLKNK